MITRDPEVAAAALAAGQLVALPTETVYGLGADATNATALARLYAVKGRPLDHPSIVHVADRDAACSGWSSVWPAAAETLAQAFWPGPLTVILPAGSRAHAAALGGTGTVALRVPALPLARAVIRHANTGIAAPSANRFGKVSPTTAQHVLEDLGESVDVILDGGPCSIGVESTIVDLTGDQPRVLRLGAITIAMIEQALQTPVTGASRDAPRAPGTLATHYAPRLPVSLVDSLAQAYQRDLSGVALIAHGPTDVEHGAIALFDPGATQALYAERLYALLRAADATEAIAIVVVLPSPGGLGDAIRDRLQRAAATTLGSGSIS